MNHRIKKKKQKLEAIHAFKWKDVKLCKKRAHLVRVEVTHSRWGMFPDKDNYAMYLRKKRRCDKLEAKIEQYFLFSEMLCMVANKRKEVKDKIFLIDGGDKNE